VNQGNSGSTLNLTVSGSTFSNAGSQGMLLTMGQQAGDNPSMTANITTSTFSGNVARDIQALTNSAASMTINIGNATANSGGTFTGVAAAMLDIDHNSTANMAFSVRNAHFTIPNTSASSVPVNIFNGSASGSATTFSGTISNNVIQGANNSCCDGISLTGSGPGAFTAAVMGNTITNVAGRGIAYSGAQSTSVNTANLTIQSNTVTMTDPNSSFGISVSAQANSTAQATVCAQIGGTNAQNTVNVSAGADYRVDSRFPTSTLRLPGYTGAAQDLTAVRNLVAANNGTTATEVSASTGLGTGGTFANSPGGAACPVP
jgi:hypothetical protein